MKISDIEKTENELANRTEVSARFISGGATPSRKQLKDALSKELKAKEELVIIRNINSEFGFQQGTLHGYVYANKEALEKFEPEYMLKRHAPKEKVEQKEAPPAEKAPESKGKEEEAPKDAEKAPEAVPKEEKKEEPKKEVPKEEKTE